MNAFQGNIAKDHPVPSHSFHDCVCGLTMNISYILLLVTVVCFLKAESFQSVPILSRSISNTSPTSLRATTLGDPEIFLNVLEYNSELNDASMERTSMLNSLIENKLVVDANSFPLGKPAGKRVSISKPGQQDSMMKVSVGCWKVIYAPHMKLGEALLGGGNIDVQYILHPNGSIESHAKLCNFPWMPGLKSIYLSVSGIYGSVSDDVCEIIWDEAWVRIISESDTEDQPHAHISDVPDSIFKSIITNAGKRLFIKPFSVFPISFLSEDLIVFDFEILGTRICARKIH